jgi:hypothetical protein
MNDSLSDLHASYVLTAVHDAAHLRTSANVARNRARPAVIVLASKPSNAFIVIVFLRFLNEMDGKMRTSGHGSG